MTVPASERARRWRRCAVLILAVGWSAALAIGLLAEEYDPIERRQVGNFPQALSHLALVRAADALAGVGAQPR